MNTEQTSKNIFTYMKTHYGEVILSKVWKLEKTMIKCSSYTNRLVFSLCCHHNKVLPKDVQLKSRMKTKRIKTILERTSKFLLQEQIHINHVVHQRPKNSMEQLKDKRISFLRKRFIKSCIRNFFIQQKRDNLMN